MAARRKKNGSAAKLGFEATLWTAAHKQRGNIAVSTPTWVGKTPTAITGVSHDHSSLQR
jgi:hypothetical protein